MRMNVNGVSRSNDRYLSASLLKTPIYYFNKFQSQFSAASLFLHFALRYMITNWSRTKRSWSELRSERLEAKGKLIVIYSSIINDSADCFNFRKSLQCLWRWRSHYRLSSSLITWHAELLLFWALLAFQISLEAWLSRDDVSFFVTTFCVDKNTM